MFESFRFVRVEGFVCVEGFEGFVRAGPDSGPGGILQ